MLSRASFICYHGLFVIKMTLLLQRLIIPAAAHVCKCGSRQNDNNIIMPSLVRPIDDTDDFLLIIIIIIGPYIALYISEQTSQSADSLIIITLPSDNRHNHFASYM